MESAGGSMCKKIFGREEDVGTLGAAVGPTNGMESGRGEGREEVEVEVVAVRLCHGHAGGVMTEDVNAAVVEGAGSDAAVAWKL